MQPPSLFTTTWLRWPPEISSTIKTTDPVQIHKIAYREILQGAPPMVIPHMLGTDENTQQAAVRRDRRANPEYSFR